MVEIYSDVTWPSWVSRPVIGSSDSNTIRWRAPRSWIRSPRMIVTEPLAKPTATCDRSSTAANAEIWEE